MPARHCFRRRVQQLGNLAAAPTCEDDLGNATSANLATLADDSAFLVVAANSVGEGSYGADGAGGERPAAAAICP